MAQHAQVVVLILVGIFTALTSGQESINAHDGFNSGMHAGISIAICFSILTLFAVVIQCIHKRQVMRNI
jgi:uncharacterized Tic20 family protein